MGVAEVVSAVLCNGDQVAVRAFDGSRAGPVDPAATIVVASPEALAYLATRPGELGLARAYVCGALEVEGDLYAALDLDDVVRIPRDPRWWRELWRLAGPAVRHHRQPPPPEEARLRGGLHSRKRDAAAVSHHYDVGNDFYRLVLGPSLTYSCAVFTEPDSTLEDAQAAKYELIAAKLGLRPGMRLLDVGCGWGGMVLAAASRHGVRAVGVTISREQADLAAKRVAEAGLADQVEIRLQDYRDITDGPFDAISSIGMFEHVGLARFTAYADRLFDLLRPGGRLLNHAISRPGDPPATTLTARAKLTAHRLGEAVGSSRANRIQSPFISRYVFPDGELLEVGATVSMLQQRGFEVRHVESLREHYALTLRRWVANLEANWDAAVDLVGPGRARVWRLYMAGSAVAFERGGLAIHQVLAAKPDSGRSGFPLRPTY